MMLRRNNVNFTIYSMAIDAGLVLANLAIANVIRPLLNGLPFIANVLPDFSIPWFLYLAFPISWVLIFQVFSIYANHDFYHWYAEAGRLLAASLFTAIFLAGALYLSFREISRFLFLMFICGAYFSTVAWRALFRFNRRRKPSLDENVRRVLIIGSGALGQQIKANLDSYANDDVKFAGFLDDQVANGVQVTQVIGNFNQAGEVIKNHHVQDVIIALPRQAYQIIENLVPRLHTLAVNVWIIPDYFELALNKANVEYLYGLPLIDLRAPALSEDQRLVKRIFDLLVTLLSFPFVLVLCVIIALIIRLESPGKVLFRQKRVGENGILFDMIKFRTMIEGADELLPLVEKKDAGGNIIYKFPNDPRVTRFGRFLRRTSLDEFPQLINVLKGEMSLVGPRPELPYLVDKYQLWQRKRFAVPQGMTGWWQVNGRSDHPMHLHTEDDLYYVHNYSFLLDIKILIKTIYVVLHRKGAY